MAKRRNFSAAFKAKVALEALRGDQPRGHAVPHVSKPEKRRPSHLDFP